MYNRAQRRPAFSGLRQFLSLDNLGKGAASAVIITLMALPRIMQGRAMVVPRTVASLAAMTLISGMAIAWGRSAGMAGILPPRNVTRKWALLAAAAVLILTPLYMLVFDPVFRQALAATGNEHAMTLRYPATLAGRLALVGWSAGFETMFFVAWPMSFMAKLTNRLAPAIAVSVLFRMLVANYQLGWLGLAYGAPFFLSCMVIPVFLSCYLFARGGILPAMLLSAGLTIHVFFVGS